MNGKLQIIWKKKNGEMWRNLCTREKKNKWNRVTNDKKLKGYNTKVTQIKKSLKKAVSQ